MNLIRTDWTREEIAGLFDLPFTELLFRAATVHREFHPPEQVQLCTLLSIKTGGCPEDCGYCSQSVKADSGVEATKLMDVRAVLQSAAQAKDAGSQRFCMGAAWRNPKDRDMPAIVEIVKGVRDMGLETCMTLGMLTPKQAEMLKEAGLDYYNHNVDTGPEYYERVISSRKYEDRLDTIQNVRDAGINVCSGGIVGMGETREDRVGFVHTLANYFRQTGAEVVTVRTPVDEGVYDRVKVALALGNHLHELAQIPMRLHRQEVLLELFLEVHQGQHGLVLVVGQQLSPFGQLSRVNAVALQGP